VNGGGTLRSKEGWQSRLTQNFSFSSFRRVRTIFMRMLVKAGSVLVAVRVLVKAVRVLEKA
jgi:hypothetical protein